MKLGDRVLVELLADLAARTPTPGGGGSAALAGALGAATAAMAVRFSDAETGPGAGSLEVAFDEGRERLLLLADEDGEAYAAWRAAPKEERAAAAVRAREVPSQILDVCGELLVALDRFAPRCNPHLASDCRVAAHLLLAGAEGARETLLVNRPEDDRRREAERSIAETRALARGICGKDA